MLRNKYAQILTLILVIQAVLFYSASHGEKTPLNQPLELFPTDLNGWQMIQQGVIEKEVQAVLRADDTLSRTYAGPSRAAANLFVAYFKTQRTGQAPHSPKNCLPGAGWTQAQTGYLDIVVPGQQSPIRINRYIVSKGDNKSVVLYWYQSRQRVIANEFAAKFWLVLDSIRYHRSDTALVRVVVPVDRNQDGPATQAGVEFVQVLFPALRQYLPA